MPTICRRRRGRFRRVDLQQGKIAFAIDRKHAATREFPSIDEVNLNKRRARSITWRLVMMRSAATKKPLPRESELPRASNVSIATADGLMRFTSSGRKSCA